MRWTERHVEQIWTLSERLGWQRLNHNHPAIVKLAARQGRLATAVSMRQKQLRTLHPDYQGKHLKAARLDQRVMDKHLTKDGE